MSRNGGELTQLKALLAPYLQEMAALQQEAARRRQAVDDIVATYLLAKGYSPQTHYLDLETGKVMAREQADEVKSQKGEQGPGAGGGGEK